jgi:cell division protein FtsB
MDDLYYRKKDSPRSLLGRLRRLLSNRKLVLTLVLGIPLLLYVVFGSHGILQRIRLERQKTELQEKIRAAEAEGKKLQEQSKALEGDKKTVEKVAREKYGMVRKGEQVYRTGKKP